MKGYPVGSVCVVINSVYNKHLIGSDVTIVKPLMLHEALESWWGYETDAVSIVGLPFIPHHEHLRLKRFPPDTEAWLREKMDDLLTKVPLAEVLNNITEEDLV